MFDSTPLLRSWYFSICEVSAPDSSVTMAPAVTELSISQGFAVCAPAAPATQQAPTNVARVFRFTGLLPSA